MDGWYIFLTDCKGVHHLSDGPLHCHDDWLSHIWWMGSPAPCCFSVWGSVTYLRGLCHCWSLLAGVTWQKRAHLAHNPASKCVAQHWMTAENSVGVFWGINVHKSAVWLEWVLVVHSCYNEGFYSLLSKGITSLASVNPIQWFALGLLSVWKLQCGWGTTWTTTYYDKHATKTVILKMLTPTLASLRS